MPAKSRFYETVTEVNIAVCGRDGNKRDRTCDRPIRKHSKDASLSGTEDSPHRVKWGEMNLPQWIGIINP